MGTEETKGTGSVSYLSLLYDIILVRDRLAWIIAELDSTIGIPEVTSEQLTRVNDFLGKKLEERKIYHGAIPEKADFSEFIAKTAEAMGEAQRGREFGGE